MQEIEMPDGTILEFPDTMADADIAVAVRGYMGEQSPQPAPQAVSAETQPEPQPSGGLARGLGLGTRAVAQGLSSIPGIVYDPIAAVQNAALGTDVKPLREQVSEGLTSLGVPQPETPRERILSSAQEGAAGALGSAGASKKFADAATGVTRIAAEKMAAAPVAQMFGGAGAGLGQQAAAEYGAGPVGQGLAALGAGLVAGGVAGTRVGPASQVDDIVQAGRQHGVRVMGTDVNQPGTFAGRWLQSVGEKIPAVGTGSARAAQATERVAAVRNFVRDYSPDLAALPDDILAGVSDDLLRGRNVALTKYSTQKGNVIKSLTGQGAVPVTRTLQKIDDEIARLDALGLDEMSPIIARLKDWRGAVQGKDITQVETIRKQLGESFKAPELASVRGEGEKVLSSIYAPLRDDMGDFIRTNGAPRDYTKWKVANMRLSQMSEDFKLTALKSVLKKGDVSPEEVKRLLFSQKVSDVRKLYKQLSPEGREHARAAILHEVMQKSGGLDDISPKRFEANIKRIPRQVSVFFNGKDGERAKGFVRLLHATRRADEAALNPPTGAQVVPIVGGMAATDLFGGFGAGMISVGTVGALARVYESPAMRPIFTALSRVKPGSAGEAALVNRAIAVLREMKERNTSAQ